MTEKASKIFNEVLDLNWKAEKEVVKFSKEWSDLQKKLGKKLTELKEEMGEVEYTRFMNNGKKMFAPKSNYDQEVENAKSIAKAKGYPYDEDLPPHLQDLED